MADYARPGDVARGHRSLQEQMRRIKTRRPLRGHVPSPTWQMYGGVTLGTVFLPALITIDPVSEGDYPEHKQIVAVDGYSTGGGDVEISWQDNTGYFYEGHIILGGSGSNRVVLPEPYIIENWPGTGFDYGGQWIRPSVQAEPAFPVSEIALVAIVEVVPV